MVRTVVILGAGWGCAQAGSNQGAGSVDGF